MLRSYPTDFHALHHRSIPISHLVRLSSLLPNVAKQIIATAPTSKTTTRLSRPRGLSNRTSMTPPTKLLILLHAETARARSRRLRHESGSGGRRLHLTPSAINWRLLCLHGWCRHSGCRFERTRLRWRLWNCGLRRRVRSRPCVVRAPCIYAVEAGEVGCGDGGWRCMFRRSGWLRCRL